jgi:hypothetical protein
VSGLVNERSFTAKDRKGGRGAYRTQAGKLPFRRDAAVYIQLAGQSCEV